MTRREAKAAGRKEIQRFRLLIFFFRFKNEKITGTAKTAPIQIIPCALVRQLRPRVTPAKAQSKYCFFSHPFHSIQKPAMLRKIKVESLRTSAEYRTNKGCTAKR